ncbi:MAG: hypothetical protein ACRBFS_03910 [Aureispira sp.]
MWNIQEAESALRVLGATYIKGQEVQLEELITSFADFYYENDIKRYKKENDGDLILLEYGMYDWGQGRYFQLDLTRQFYKPTNIKQLQLTLFYDPMVTEIAALEATNFWSGGYEKKTWIEKAKTTAAFEVLEKQPLIKHDIKLNLV